MKEWAQITPKKKGNKKQESKGNRERIINKTTIEHLLDVFSTGNGSLWIKEWIYSN